MVENEKVLWDLDTKESVSLRTSLHNTHCKAMIALMNQGLDAGCLMMASGVGLGRSQRKAPVTLEDMFKLYDVIRGRRKSTGARVGYGLFSMALECTVAHFAGVDDLVQPELKQAAKACSDHSKAVEARQDANVVRRALGVEVANDDDGEEDASVDSNSNGPAAERAFSSLKMEELKALFKDHGWVHVDDHAVPKIKATAARVEQKIAMQTRLRQNGNIPPPELVAAAGVGREADVGVELPNAGDPLPSLRLHVGRERLHPLQLYAVYGSDRLELAVRATNDEMTINGHPEVIVELRAIAVLQAQVHQRLAAVEATHTLPEHVGRVVDNPPLDALLARLVAAPGESSKKFVPPAMGGLGAKDHGEKPKRKPLFPPLLPPLFAPHCFDSHHCFDVLSHLVWLIGSFFDGRSWRQDVCSSTTSGR